MTGPDGAWESRRLADLPREQRLRLVSHTAMRISIVVLLMFVAYGLAPLTHHLAEANPIRVLLAIGLFAVVVAWQLRAIQLARYPALRAIEGFALIVPLLLLGFATVYLRFSAADSSAFNETLDHVGALYLSMTIMSTVGFGDISAATHAARITVMLHMVANVIVLGVVTRIMINGVRVGTGRSRDEPVDRAGGAGR